MLGVIEAYTKTWNDCVKCPLHRRTKKKVIFRGKLPSDVLFLGESPGRVEETLGKPFVGPSGRLLQQAIDQLNLRSFALTNLVCCSVGDNHQLALRHAKDCREHVVELVELARPKLLVTLGDIARRGAPTELPVPMVHLVHPAYILRNGGATSPTFSSFLDKLTTALTTHRIPHSSPWENTSIVKGITHHVID